MRVLWALVCWVFSRASFLWGVAWDVLVSPILAVSLLIRCLWLKGPMDEYWARQPQLPPLIVVHGSGSSDHQALPAWWYLRRHFNVRTVQLNAFPWPDSSEDMHVYANRLNDRVTQVLAESPGFHQVWLLGVSMGGVVAGLVATQRPRDITGVITLGSPWRGTPAADILALDTARHAQFKPGSDFVAQLEARVAEEPFFILSIGSTADAWVPDEYAHPPGQRSLRLQHPMGHLSGVLFPFAWRSICQWMDRFASAQ